MLSGYFTAPHGGSLPRRGLGHSGTNGRVEGWGWGHSGTRGRVAGAGPGHSGANGCSGSGRAAIRARMAAGGGAAAGQLVRARAWSARCSVPNHLTKTAIAATAIVALPRTIKTAPATVWSISGVREAISRGACV